MKTRLCLNTQLDLVSLSLFICVCVGSSTVDLLIYQTLCYALDDLDVCEYLLKVCGHDEYLDK